MLMSFRNIYIYAQTNKTGQQQQQQNNYNSVPGKRLTCSWTDSSVQQIELTPCRCPCRS